MKRVPDRGPLLFLEYLQFQKKIRIIFSDLSPKCRNGSIIVSNVVVVGIARSKVNMHRLSFSFRVLAVAVSFPVILLVIACATLLHPITPLKTSIRTPIRLWMSVMDWIKGIPIGYSYWEQYQAPMMLDEIAVHHDE